MPETFYVYILESQKDSRRYIGKTSNLARRITEHYLGKNKSTKYRLPLVLIHVETYSTSSAAAKREYYLKSLKGGNELKQILHAAPPIESVLQPAGVVQW